MNSFYSKENYSSFHFEYTHHLYAIQFADSHKRRGSNMDVKAKVKPSCEFQKQPFMRFNNNFNPNKKSHKIIYPSPKKPTTSHKLPQQNQTKKVNTPTSNQQFEKWKHDLLVESDDEEDEESFMMGPTTGRKAGSTSRISHQMALYEKIDGIKCKIVNAKDVEVPLTSDIICDDVSEFDYEEFVPCNKLRTSSNVDVNSNSNFSLESLERSSTGTWQSSNEDIIEHCLEDGYNYEYEAHVQINHDFSIDHDWILANTCETESGEVDSRVDIPNVFVLQI
jgi:hypothetical protein